MITHITYLFEILVRGRFYTSSSCNSDGPWASMARWPETASARRRSREHRSESHPRGDAPAPRRVGIGGARRYGR